MRSSRIPALTGVLVLSIAVWFPSTARAVPWKIMPMGDSITEGHGSSSDGVPVGYRLPLKQLLNTAHYSTDFVGSVSWGGMTDSEHEGHGGYTIPQLDELTAAARITTYQPDVTLLMIGTNANDHGSWSSREKLNTLVTHIEGVTLRNGQKTKLIIATITPNSTDNQYFQMYNSRIPGVVAEHQALGEPVTMVDMFSALDPEKDLYDWVHPNASGYQKMANVWFAGLQSVLPTLSKAPEPQGWILLVTGLFTCGFLTGIHRRRR
jgi:lysophospholipase L1-like esterase